MADTAAHLVDRVLPEVPVHQWVLSLPFTLRYRLAYDARLASVWGSGGSASGSAGAVGGARVGRPRHARMAVVVVDW